MSKKSIFVVVVMGVLASLFSCVTVDRPDLPPVKNAEGTYVAKQDKFLGLVPMGVKYERVETEAEKAKDAIQRPAKWILMVCLPIALIAFAASLVIQNPKLTKKLVLCAGIALVASVFAGVWLLLTMWLAVFGVIALVAGYLLYEKFHGRGIFLKEK